MNELLATLVGNCNVNVRESMMSDVKGNETDDVKCKGVNYSQLL